MNRTAWNQEFEPTRRQRGGGRGRGRHGHGGPWGGPWGGPTGGPPPWVGQMFGPDFVGGPGGRGGRRPRVRRGDVRSAILDVLSTTDEPINGYQVIQQIADRTDGVWKPSPGSVYPTIAQLQDEGLVEDAPTGRKAIRLTDEGRAYVGAIVQVATTGTPDQRQKAIDILGDTRRRLYGLLAEGPDAAEDEDSEEE